MTNQPPFNDTNIQAGTPAGDPMATQEPPPGLANNDPFATPTRVAGIPTQATQQATAITPGAATTARSPDGQNPEGSPPATRDGTMGTNPGNDPPWVGAQATTEITNSNLQLQTFIATQGGSQGGPLTKASMVLGAGGSLLAAAALSKQLYDTWMAEGTNHTPAARLQAFGEQPAPLVFLAVRHPDNKLVLTHGIKTLVVPFGHQHRNNGQPLAFVDEATGNTGLPMIAKLSPLDFGAARDWLHPTVTAVLTANAQQVQVLPVTGDNSFQSSPKIIPIPLFLVPFFVNNGDHMTAIQGFQRFYTLFATAEDSVKTCTRHIFNFLLIATGYVEIQEFEPQPASQLAIQMEELQLDPVLAHWATNQFGGIWQIANLHDATRAATEKQPPQNTGENIQTVQSPPVAERQIQENNPLLADQIPWEATNNMATGAMGTHNWGTPAPTAPAAPNPDATIMALAPGVAMTPDATIMALAPGGAMTPMQTQNLALNTPRPPPGGTPMQGTPTSNLPQGRAYGNLYNNPGLAFTPATMIPAQQQQLQGNQLQLPPFPYGNQGW